MSLEQRISSDEQLTRLLQIGVVLEELVEARSHSHYRSLTEAERDRLDDELEQLLAHAAEESAEHRAHLEALIDDLGGESVPFEEIESLVRRRYGRTKPSDFDGILYDQLHGEETAYKFYDDLIGAIEESDVAFGVDRERLLETLRWIRDEEAEGVEEVTALMEGRA